jgi:tRNA threonylcarbamoyladenosine biosynthesis protein TsaE
MKIMISKSVKDTQKLAKEVAKNLKGGEILALVGDLGGGKTHFSKGVCEYFNVKQEVQSPTFTLINEYYVNKKDIKTIYHMDMYRLENEKEAQNLGLFEIFEDKTGVCLIEWADKIKNLLPKRTKFIEFDFVDENTRKIKIN